MEYSRSNLSIDGLNLSNLRLEWSIGRVSLSKRISKFEHDNSSRNMKTEFIETLTDSVALDIELVNCRLSLSNLRLEWSIGRLSLSKSHFLKLNLTHKKSDPVGRFLKYIQFKLCFSNSF